MLSLGLLTIPLLAGQAAAWKTTGVAEMKKLLKSGESNLIAFVMPDMKSSEALLPEWEKLSNSDFNTVAVDCATTPEICSELDVVSFPAIRHYRSDGRVTRYRGPRKAEPMTTFAHRVLNPSINAVTAENATSFSRSDDIVMIARLRPEHNNLLNRYCKFADLNRDELSFAIAGIDYEANEKSHVECFNNLEGTQYSASNLDWIGALDDLVEKCKDPWVPSMNQGSEPRYDTGEKSLVYYFSNDEAERIKYTKMIRPVAEKHSYLRFVTVDSNDYVDLPYRVGISNKKGLSMRNYQNGQVYVYKGKIEAQAIAEFIDNVTKDQVSSWSWWEGPQVVETDQSVQDVPAEQDVPVEKKGHDEL